MKSFSLLFFALFMLFAAFFTANTQASFCPCDLTQKGQVCGSNGITYKNRCEFDCTQKDYKKLGRVLNIAKQGPC